jgi:hypothetical protein
MLHPCHNFGHQVSIKYLGMFNRNNQLTLLFLEALKVEYTGSNKADIISVRSYMEKIGSTNLPRQQIHFPRYDATRYRELYNQKVHVDY